MSLEFQESGEKNCNIYLFKFIHFSSSLIAAMGKVKGKWTQFSSKPLCMDVVFLSLIQSSTTPTIGKHDHLASSSEQVPIAWLNPLEASFQKLLNSKTHSYPRNYHSSTFFLSLLINSWLYFSANFLVSVQSDSRDLVTSSRMELQQDLLELEISFQIQKTHLLLFIDFFLDYAIMNSFANFHLC